MLSKKRKKVKSKGEKTKEEKLKELGIFKNNKVYKYNEQDESWRDVG